MSYQQNGKIEAADINVTLAGSASASAASTTLNAIWGVGSGDRGYGQTPYVPNVIQNSKVDSVAFATVVNTTETVAKHQNTTLANSIAPGPNQIIEYANGVLLTNINTVNTNRLNAKLQGSSATTTATNNVIWNDTLTFTFKVAFPSANQARYFFNCGGQLALTFSHPTGSTGTGSTGAVNTLFNQLCTACGTIVISAMSNGTATILTTSYRGVSKIGGSGTPMVLAQDKGYYGLTTSYQSIFMQKASSVVPGYYSDSFLDVSARTNGAITSNGDNGDTVYIQVQLDQVPNSAAVKAGTTVNLVAIPPAQANVVPGAFLPVKSWAMPVVSYTSAATGVPAASLAPAPAPAPAPPSPTFNGTAIYGTAAQNTTPPGGSNVITVIGQPLPVGKFPQGYPVYWRVDPFYVGRAGYAAYSDFVGPTSGIAYADSNGNAKFTIQLSSNAVRSRNVPIQTNLSSGFGGLNYDVLFTIY